MFRGFLYDGDSSTVEPVLDHGHLARVPLPSDEKEAFPLCQTHSFLWLDLRTETSTPTLEQLDVICDRFHLDAQTRKSVGQILADAPQEKDKTYLKPHNFDNYVYFVFHAMTPREGEKGELSVNTQEIACLLGPDWILTFHSQPIQAFNDLAPWWQRHSGCLHNGPAYLLYRLMDAVLDGYSEILEKFSERIETFDDRLYNPDATVRNTELLTISREILALKLILLKMRHNAGTLRDVVKVLLRRDSEEGEKHASDFQKLHDHASHIVEKNDAYREVLNGALNMCQAIESNRMNAVMNRFTIFSMLLLPPTLIAGIYGMNFLDMPIQHGFRDSIIAMITTATVLLAFFRVKKWI